jgi:hypothetical protein
MRWRRETTFPVDLVPSLPSSFAAALLDAPSWLRVPLGLLFVLAFPGYAFVAAPFPSGRGLPRVALSLGPFKANAPHLGPRTGAWEPNRCPPCPALGEEELRALIVAIGPPGIRARKRSCRSCSTADPDAAESEEHSGRPTGVSAAPMMSSRPRGTGPLRA